MSGWRGGGGECGTGVGPSLGADGIQRQFWRGYCTRFVGSRCRFGNHIPERFRRAPHVSSVSVKPDFKIDIPCGVGRGNQSAGCDVVTYKALRQPRNTTTIKHHRPQNRCKVGGHRSLRGYFFQCAIACFTKNLPQSRIQHCRSGMLNLTELVHSGWALRRISVARGRGRFLVCSRVG